MKHRLLLLLLFVFTAVMTGWAQNSATPSYTVKGVLLDSLTQDGEPYATIKITKKGAPDKAVKMADRKSTRLNSSHKHRSRMPSSA